MNRLKKEILNTKIDDLHTLAKGLIEYETLELEEIKELKVHDEKLEDIADSYDVFIGSNSTAIIEASLFGKLSVLLKTVKFGDYFDHIEQSPSRTSICCLISKGECPSQYISWMRAAYSSVSTPIRAQIASIWSMVMFRSSGSLASIALFSLMFMRILY